MTAIKKTTFRPIADVGGACQFRIMKNEQKNPLDSAEIHLSPDEALVYSATIRMRRERQSG